MSQSYPWLKMPHREYMISASYMALKPIERLALLELAMYAHTRPNNSLPDDDNFLAAYARLSTKQWLKIKASVFSEWFLVDGFWLLPDWFSVESAPVNQQQEQPKEEKPLSNAERCKRYRDNKKNVGDTNDTNSDTLNMSSDTTATRKQHDTDTAKSVDSVSFEGGKGGDLDLEQELDQEVKKRSSSSAGAGASLPEFTSKPAAVDAGSLAETFPDRPASPPADWLALAKADYPQADHSGEWVKFRNHFWPLTGDRRTLAKWQSAWLGWIGRAGSAVPKAAAKAAKQPAGAGAAVNAPFQAEIDAMGYRPPTPEEHAQFLREMGETA